MIEVQIDRVAHGGDGVGRVDGKALFVPGGLPGDRAVVEVFERRKRFDRGHIVDLVQPSPHRTIPVCRHTSVCGGCAWQEADYQAQLGWKRDMVAAQLRHLGGVEIDVPATAVVGPTFHYRNRMDYSVVDGRLALHRRGSAELVSLEECRLVAEPLAHVVSAVRGIEGLGGAGRRVTLRAGVGTGDLIAVVDHPLDGLPVPQAHPSEAVIHEMVDGRRFRISGRAFFQANTAGAQRLVELVREAVRPGVGSRADGVPLDGGTVLDIFSGVGLFAATVAPHADRVVAFEIDRRAAEDLEINLSFEEGPEVDVVVGPVDRTLEAWSSPVSAVVVDPPRQGMEQRVVDSIVRLGPPVIASVSCDPATFARDTRRLIDAGYTLDWVQPVDCFPHTPHVEIVARMHR